MIERGEKGRNFLLDTRQERRKITLARRLKQLQKASTKKIKNNPPRKLTRLQRQTMLRNLAKARRMRGKASPKKKTVLRNPPTPKKNNNNAVNRQRLLNLQKARKQKRLNAQGRRRATAATRLTTRRRIISII